MSLVLLYSNPLSPVGWHPSDAAEDGSPPRGGLPYRRVRRSICAELIAFLYFGSMAQDLIPLIAGKDPAQRAIALLRSPPQTGFEAATRPEQSAAADGHLPATKSYYHMTVTKAMLEQLKEQGVPIMYLDLEDMVHRTGNMR